MGSEFKDLLPALLGPVGTLAFALIVIWGFVTERIVPKRRLDEVKELLQKSHELSKEGVGLTAEAMREEIWRAEIDRQLAQLRGQVNVPPKGDV